MEYLSLLDVKCTKWNYESCLNCTCTELKYEACGVYIFLKCDRFHMILFVSRSYKTLKFWQHFIYLLMIKMTCNIYSIICREKLFETPQNAIILK